MEHRTHFKMYFNFSSQIFCCVFFFWINLLKKTTRFFVYFRFVVLKYIENDFLKILHLVQWPFQKKFPWSFKISCLLNVYHNLIIFWAPDSPIKTRYYYLMGPGLAVGAGQCLLQDLWSRHVTTGIRTGPDVPLCYQVGVIMTVTQGFPLQLRLRKTTFT